MPLPLTLCIPTIRRWHFLKDYIPQYLQNPYINEIVITDETGEDVEKIKEMFGHETKLRLFVNEQRLGAYLNKEKAVSLATNDWVVLIDSDNFAPLGYFEAWNKEVQENGIAVNNIFAPCKTLPTPTQSDIFDLEHLIGLHVTAQNYQVYRKVRLFDLMENMGNYIFHKDFYLKAKSNNARLIENRGILDVQVKNAYLLKAGATIIIVPHMKYVHVVHKESIYLQTLHEQDTVKPAINALLDSI